MLSDYHTTMAEHRYRGDRIQRHCRRTPRKPTKAPFAALLLVTALVLGYGTTETSKPDDAKSAGQIMEIDEPRSASLPQTPEVPGFEPVPAPTWEPNWATLDQHRSNTSVVPGFEPVPAPSWEPNWAALDQHRSERSAVISFEFPEPGLEIADSRKLP